jgi:hypothetical protein
LVEQAINSPESVYEGSAGERLATRTGPDGKIVVVVYREDASQGFVITAFLTRRAAQLAKRRKLWPL